MLSFGLLLPVLPFVVEQHGGGDVAYGLLLACFSAFQFIGAPWLGRLSDSTGRKPVLLITQIGTLIAWIVFGAAWFLPNIQIGFAALPLFVIGFARMLDGITGGNHAVTQAYVSDISTKKEKALIFTNTGGVAGIGLIIGPGIGGTSRPHPLVSAVAICGVVLSIVTLISIQWHLKESLPLSLESRIRKNHC